MDFFIHICVDICTLFLGSPPAIERLSSGLFQEVIITNTIPVAEKNYFPQLTVLSVANLLGETIWRVHDDCSVSSIFQQRRNNHWWQTLLAKETGIPWQGGEGRDHRFKIFHSRRKSIHGAAPFFLPHPLTCFFSSIFSRLGQLNISTRYYLRLCSKPGTGPWLGFVYFQAKSRLSCIRTSSLVSFNKYMDFTHS